MSQNRELIKSLYEAFARGDAATVLDALAPDVQWYEAEGTSWADGNPYDSPQRVSEEVIGRILAEYDGYMVDPHKFLADEDMVVALGHYTGTHRASGQLFHAPSRMCGRSVTARSRSFTSTPTPPRSSASRRRRLLGCSSQGSPRNRRFATRATHSRLSASTTDKMRIDPIFASVLAAMRSGRTCRTTALFRRFGFFRLIVSSSSL
jgi:uncharacterized protein